MQLLFYFIKDQGQMYRNPLRVRFDPSELITLFDQLLISLGKTEDLDPFLKGVPETMTDQEYLELLRPPKQLKPKFPLTLDSIAALAILDTIISAPTVAVQFRIASDSGIKAIIEPMLEEKIDTILLEKGPEYCPGLKDVTYSVFFDDFFFELVDDYIFYYGLEDNISWYQLSVEYFELSDQEEMDLRAIIAQGLSEGQLNRFEQLEGKYPLLSRFAFKMSEPLQESLQEVGRFPDDNFVNDYGEVEILRPKS